MNNFDRNRRSSGGPNRFPRRDFSRPVQMHSAVCATCGNECQIPFKPTGERPVYCSSCFEKSRDSGAPPREREERSSFKPTRSPSFQPAQVPACGCNSIQLTDQLKSINVKLDKILATLEIKTPVKKAPKKEVEVSEEKA